MKLRQLGKNGPHLTIVGFGAWAIGGPWQWGWGDVDDKESIAAIHSAIENGINWIDTAAVYGFGHSEKIVAAAVNSIREKVFIATKCGMINDGSGNAAINNHPDNIRKECEESLRRLNTEYIDLYQIHWPDENVEVERSWEMMVRLKEEGKVKYIGVSNFDVPLLERCMKIEHVQSLQPPFSLLNRKVEAEILPYCLENGIGVVAYSPMQAGLLTGKFDINKLAPDDWRRRGSSFRQPFLSKALNLVEELRIVADRKNCSVGNLAVAWVLSNPSVTSAIVGARNSEQVQENIISAQVELSDTDLNEIAELLNETGL